MTPWWYLILIQQTNRKEVREGMKKCRVEVFSRVTGFFRPVQDWNKGKTEEFRDRRTFSTKGMLSKKDQYSSSHV